MDNSYPADRARSPVSDTSGEKNEESTDLITSTLAPITPEVLTVTKDCATSVQASISSTIVTDRKSTATSSPAVISTIQYKRRGQNYANKHKAYFGDNLCGLSKEIYDKIRRSKPREKYAIFLRNEGDPIPEETMTELRESRSLVPPYLSRAYSIAGIHRSSGFTSRLVIMPNSHRHKLGVFESISEMTDKDFATMLGRHLAWRNPVEDQLTSYTNSIIFILTHMPRRHEGGQHGVHWSFGDVRKLTTVDGDQAEFYPANKLLEKFPRSLMESIPKGTRARLHERHFGHEALAWSELWNLVCALVDVTYEDLVKAGLFAICPEMRIEGGARRNGLYMHQVALKRELHYLAQETPITEEDLVLADNVAKLFRREGEKKAPLWLLLMLLGIRKRPKDNSTFRAWIKERYSGIFVESDEDINDCTYPEMHKIPVNQPDVIQTLKLFYEAISALRISDIHIHSIQSINPGGIFSEDHLSYSKTRPMNTRSRRIFRNNWHLGTSEAEEALQKYAQELEGAAAFPEPDSETENESEYDSDGDDGDNDDTSAPLTNPKKRKRTRVTKDTKPPKGKKVRLLYGVDSEKELILEDLKKMSRRLLKRDQSRKQMDECHEYFERKVKPKLVAKLTSGNAGNGGTGLNDDDNLMDIGMEKDSHGNEEMVLSYA